MSLPELEANFLSNWYYAKLPSQVIHVQVLFCKINGAVCNKLDSGYHGCLLIPYGLLRATREEAVADPEPAVPFKRVRPTPQQLLSDELKKKWICVGSVYSEKGALIPVIRGTWHEALENAIQEVTNFTYYIPTLQYLHMFMFYIYITQYVNPCFRIFWKMICP